jgi:uncharacterized membrane protein YbaN (DUF454 family)
MKRTPQYTSPLLRFLLIIAGSISVGLGVLGIVLPVLPTTPFLLLAAWCYARSSTRFYVWLMTHRLWGKYLRDYTSGKGVPARIKVSALTLLWAAILSSAFLAVEKTWLRILLIGIAMAVSIHILMIKTLQKQNPDKKF